MSTEPLSTPLQFLKGVGPRRAADLAHVGLRTVEDLLYRFPIRYEDRSRLQPIASLQPGQTASVTGRIVELRPALDAAAGLQDLRSARHRRERLDARHLAEPAVSARRVRARAAGGAVRPRRDARSRRPAADQPAVRNPRRRGRRDDPHRPDRAGLREGRQRHAEDSAPAGPRRAAAACPTICRIRCPRRFASRLDLPSRCAALLAAHFPPADVPARCAESLRHAGAAAADLRGGVSVSDRRARAAPQRDGRVASRRSCASTIGFASRRGACCRSS